MTDRLYGLTQQLLLQTQVCNRASLNSKQGCFAFHFTVPNNSEHMVVYVNIRGVTRLFEEHK